MLDSLQMLNGIGEWGIFFFCALMIGMSKTGVQNIGTFTIPLFALLFGAKDSTGVVLPLLCVADVMAVIYYRKKFHASYIFKLLPWAIAGLLVALGVGHIIPENGFKILMGACILVGVIIMVWMERTGRVAEITAAAWFSPAFGFLVGFSTMIGNAAGPLLTVYFLSMRLPKYAFIATGAWFIIILNYLKIPLQIFVWDNLSWKVLLLDLTAIPFLILGGIMGIQLIKILPEKQFKTLMIVLTVASTLFLFV